jgi:hypothetical protein
VQLVKLTAYPRSLPEYVWYVGYGSNLDRERFICYIEGGTPPGTLVEYRGCSDPSGPSGEFTTVLDRQLQFAGISTVWAGGICFLGKPGGVVLARGWKVSVPQLIEVARQEGSRNAMPGHLLDAIHCGSCDLRGGKYGKITYLGDYSDAPAFCLESVYLRSDYRLPSHSYISLMVRGLREGFALSDDQVVDYLESACGMEGWQVADWAQVFGADYLCL